MSITTSKSPFQDVIDTFTKERAKRNRSISTPLLLWNQAVAVLREDNYQITQSTRNYATVLSQVGLGSPADEIDNCYAGCNCHQCEQARADPYNPLYDSLDAYRNYRDELRGGGYWE